MCRMIPLPRHERHWKDLRRTIAHLHLDDQLRRDRFEIVFVLDFFLLYRRFIQCDGSSEHQFVEGVLDRVRDPLLFLPPSQLEMNDALRAVSSKVGAIDTARLARFCRCPGARSLVDAYHRYEKPGRDIAALSDMWEAYRELRKEDRLALRWAVFMSRFGSTYVDPLKQLKQFLESDRFLQPDEVLRRFGDTRFKRDEVAARKALDHLRRYRPDERKERANATDALVHGICTNLNSEARRGKHRMRFRNLTDGVNARVLWYRTADDSEQLPGLSRGSSDCRDVRAVVLGILASERSWGEGADCRERFPEWEQWYSNLDAMVECAHRVAEGGAPITLEELQVRDWCWRWTYHLPHAEFDTAERVMATAERASGDLNDADPDHLLDFQVARMRLLAEAFDAFQGATPEALEAEKRVLMKSFNDTLRSLARFLDQQSPDEKWKESTKTELADLRWQAGISSPLVDKLTDLLEAAPHQFSGDVGRVELAESLRQLLAVPAEQERHAVEACLGRYLTSYKNRDLLWLGLAVQGTLEAILHGSLSGEPDPGTAREASQGGATTGREG